MKKFLFAMIAFAAVLSFAACNDSETYKDMRDKNYKDYIPYSGRQFTFHCCLNFSCMHWIHLPLISLGD